MNRVKAIELAQLWLASGRRAEAVKLLQELRVNTPKGNNPGCCSRKFR
jgi:hypothetical protein